MFELEWFELRELLLSESVTLAFDDLGEASCIKGAEPCRWFGSIIDIFDLGSPGLADSFKFASNRGVGLLLSERWNLLGSGLSFSFTFCKPNGLLASLAWLTTFGLSCTAPLNLDVSGFAICAFEVDAVASVSVVGVAANAFSGVAVGGLPGALSSLSAP